MISQFINSLPALSSAELKSIFFIVFAILTANLGLFIFNCVFSNSASKENNNLAGVFFGIISMLYSLILAFVIMAEWEDFNSLNKTIALETDRLNSIMAHSSNLPDTLKVTIGNSLAGYCKQVMSKEWTMQEKKFADYPSAIPVLRHLLLTTNPENTMQENILKIIDDDLSDISDLRRDRLSHTYSQLPDLVWNVLKAGAVLLIIFSYFFKTSQIRLQKVYLSFFVCLLAMCFSIVYHLDHPFLPGSGLNNTSYQKVLSELTNYYLPKNAVFKLLP